MQTGNIAAGADGRKVLDIEGRIYRNDIGWQYTPCEGQESNNIELRPY